MTNEQIIMGQSQSLAEAGVIRYTGRILKTALPDGTEAEFRETEPIHTFSEWQRMGYKVKAGEHAVAKFQIWKPAEKKQEEREPGTVQIESIRMFLKMSNFFSLSQVERRA